MRKCNTSYRECEHYAADGQFPECWACELKRERENFVDDPHTCEGPVRGACGVIHRSVDGALKHCAVDAARCARIGGGAYSDRSPVRV